MENAVAAGAVTALHAGFVAVARHFLQQFAVAQLVVAGQFAVHQIERGLADEFLPRNGKVFFEGAVDQPVFQLGVLHIHRQRHGFDQLFDKVQLFLQTGAGLVAGGDVGADGHVLVGAAIVIQKRHDGGGYPVQAAILGAVADFSGPHLAGADAAPHLGEESSRMKAGIDQVVALPLQLVEGVAADLAEFVVGVGNDTVAVGNADDGMLVEGEFLVFQCQLSLADGLLSALAGLHQLGHHADQRFQVASLRGVVGHAGFALQQPHGFPQAADGVFAAGQFLLQALVGAAQFVRAELQAAGAQADVAVLLGIGAIDPLQQAGQPLERSGGRWRDGGAACQAGQLGQHLLQLAVIGDAHCAPQLAHQNVLHEFPAGVC